MIGKETIVTQAILTVLVLLLASQANAQVAAEATDVTSARSKPSSMHYQETASEIARSGLTRSQGITALACTESFVR